MSVADTMARSQKCADILKYLAIALLYTGLASCAMSEATMEKEQPGSYFLRDGENIIADSDLKMSRKEFKDNLLPLPLAQQPGQTPKAIPSIPTISPLLVAPRPPEAGINTSVSLSVTEDIPLKDVLLELARLADVDVELDPRISGGIILRVKDKPFNEVMERIASLANLRYSFDNRTIKIERDLPYIENYKVDFLNISRSNQSSSSINTKVISQVSGGIGGGGSDDEGSIQTGTTSSLSSNYDGNLWLSVRADIARILNLDPKDPDKQDDKGDDTSTNDSVDIFNQTNSSSKKKSTGRAGRNFLSVNQQAGLITVRGTSTQHSAIQEYLDRTKRSVSAQVLIEAKVVEVSLGQKYRTGINWSLLDNNTHLSLTGGFTQAIQGESDLINLGVLNDAGTDLEAAVNLTEFFGTSRTLSSPRLHAINNQQAVLSFAFNQVFFTLDAQEQEDRFGDSLTRTLNINSEVNTIPIGVVLNLQPSIDLDTNEITMNIRPTLSRIKEVVDDPGVALIAARNNVTNIRSTIPVVEVRELDSVLKIQSGQIMVIGGLMEERNTNDETGVPVLSTMPLFGKLFKGVAKDSEVVETVIFIKATVVPGYGVSKPDQHLYRTYVRDPRPLAF